MWLELGDNTLVNLDQFCHFVLTDNGIYGVRAQAYTGLWQVYEGDDAEKQFNLICAALRWKQGGGQYPGQPEVK